MMRGRLVVGALLACAVLFVPRRGNAANLCNNGTLDTGEVCDCVKVGSVMTCRSVAFPLGGATCQNYPGGGYNGGSLDCKSGCLEFDFKKCIHWDGVIDSAVVATDAGMHDITITADTTHVDASVTPPATPTCRTYTGHLTVFEPGSLIIPMDLSHTTAQGMVRAYGLVWQLLNYGIRVAWILNTTKNTVHDVDFTVMGTTADIPVERLDRSAVTNPYDTFISLDTTTVDVSCPSGTGVCVHYASAPFVIPAADADAALQIIHHGVLPQDSSIKFGWKFGSEVYTDFGIVPIHRAKIGFSAPVLRMTAAPPKPMALYDVTTSGTTGPAHSWLTSELLTNGGLYWDTGIAPAGGTPSAPGLIFDDVANADLEGSTSGTSVLATGHYQMAWLNGDAMGALSDGSHDKIADFVNAGNGLVASGWAVLELECHGCDLVAHGNDSVRTCGSPSAGCAQTTNFQGTSGMSESSGGGGTSVEPLEPGSTPAVAINPFTQVDTMEYHTYAEELRKYLPTTTWKPCAHPLIRLAGGDVLASVLDDANKGVVFYAGGRNYTNGGATQKLAMQKTIVSLLFLGADQTQEEHPDAEERTRSTPIVVERVDGTTTHIFSTQGSFLWPPPSQQVFFDPAQPSDWRYPLHAGHLRVYDLTTLTAGTMSTFAGLSTSILWDGAGAMPAVPSRRIYTAMSTSTTGADPSPLAVRKFAPLDPAVAADAALLSTYYPLLGMPNSTAALTLIQRVEAATMGGIDLATPAYIPKGTGVRYGTMSTGLPYERPAVVYAASLDGLLHAFRVKDLENDSGAFGDELWAFLPPNLLPLLRTNDAEIQASPAVADAVGDFLAATGTAGQDGHKETITLLALTTGESGRAVYALDVSNPDPANTFCPLTQTTTSCVSGPNPLWVSSPAEMGSSRGAAIAAAMCNVTTCAGQIRPYIYVSTNYPTSTGTGARIFKLDATTGQVEWRRDIVYDRPIPVQGVYPNDIPAPLALVDKTGLAGYQTHIYFPDMQGRLWELDAKTGEPTTSDGGAIWDAATQFDDGSGEATYPIPAPVALYRASDDSLHVVLASGGVYWAPSNASIKQALVDVNVSVASAGGTVLQQFAIGERVYSAPIVSNQDVYVIASEGAVDVLSSWSVNGGAGVLYRKCLTGSTSTALQVNLTGGMTGASIGVTKSGNLVTTTGRQTGVMANTGQGTGTSSKPDKNTAGEVISQLRLWLPGLNRGREGE